MLNFGLGKDRFFVFFGAGLPCSHMPNEPRESTRESVHASRDAVVLLL